MFKGLRKQGDEYQAFVAANPGKTVISRPQQIRAEAYKDAYTKCPTAVKLLKGGFAEQTICVKLSDVPIKIRCDYINPEAGYIADVKTSAMPVDIETVRLTCSRWGYDLSAALYAKAAEQHYGKPFSFYFIFIAKTDLVCAVYKASDDMINRGTEQIGRAISLYKQCMRSGEWRLQAPKVVEDEEILEV
jgi:hypothetical protein